MREAMLINFVASIPQFRRFRSCFHL